MDDKLKIVFIGLSITSSWGNGHATTYRGLVRELSELGHDVIFLEYDAPWYRENRDMENPPFGRTFLYKSVGELTNRWAKDLRNADLTIVGSFVDCGVEVGEWVCSTSAGVKAFYDIDTPVTLAAVEGGCCKYLTSDLISKYDLYLSFTGGPILTRLEREFKARCARPLYCSFDPSNYYPEEQALLWDLGYMGTYSDDRQPTLDELLVKPAWFWDEGRYTVAGPQYPESLIWPSNVLRVEHLPPSEHRNFYNSQRFTLNVTRADMIAAGYSPSVRLFEAAACGVPIISDFWNGLNSFFSFGEEILVSQTAKQTLHFLQDLDEDERKTIGERARSRALSAHTSRHRAEELLTYVREV